MMPTRCLTATDRAHHILARTNDFVARAAFSGTPLFPAWTPGTPEPVRTRVITAVRRSASARIQAERSRRTVAAWGPDVRSFVARTAR
jgi:hypothetical protein